LVLDSTILENIPMESNHQLNWNITLSDVHIQQADAVLFADEMQLVPKGFGSGAISGWLQWFFEIF
jgi:hypothetical protein